MVAVLPNTPKPCLGARLRGIVPCAPTTSASKKATFIEPIKRLQKKAVQKARIVPGEKRSRRRLRPHWLATFDGSQTFGAHPTYHQRPHGRRRAKSLTLGAHDESFDPHQW